MSENSSSSPRSASSQRIKLALIPILACCLWYIASPAKVEVPIAVVHRADQSQRANQTTQGPTSAVVPPPTLISKNAVNAKPTSADIPETGLKTSVSWPTLSVTEIVRNNPFELPASLRPVVPAVAPPNEPEHEDVEPLPEYADEVREALNGKRLTALIQTPKGIAALIGDDVVRAGDRVGERLRVAAIRQSGVVLELVDRASPKSRRGETTRSARVELPVTP